jgi:hypothetical protein
MLVATCGCSRHQPKFNSYQVYCWYVKLKLHVCVQQAELP